MHWYEVATKADLLKQSSNPDGRRMLKAAGGRAKQGNSSVALPVASIQIGGRAFRLSLLIDRWVCDFRCRPADLGPVLFFCTIWSFFVLLH